MIGLDRNEQIRLAALARAEELRRQWDDRVPAREIERGFDFGGHRVRFVGPGMGIFKPRQLTDGPITVRTQLASSYDDEPLEAGAGLRYDFAPPAREYDNDGLKRLCELGRPLIYLIQVAPRAQGSEYAILAPVFVTGWDDARRTFEISFRAARSLTLAQGDAIAERPARDRVEPAYRMVELRARLYQAHFRRLVLQAYRHRCTVCELRVRPLLDAAHIVPDRDGGDASVQNGLGLCVLHHRAFDRGLLRVRPDYTVDVAPTAVPRGDDFAARTLLEFHGRHIVLPRDRALWPSAEALHRIATA
ncbi:MAG: HNH endonuclease [Planctomycetes bacterium]|nr:HNH endonuclease [Planctomycetota bacterium]